jgi:hypothetical protein
MGKIFKEMNGQMPEALFWLNVLLSTAMAITAHEIGTAIKTFPIRAFRQVRQKTSFQ